MSKILHVTKLMIGKLLDFYKIPYNFNMLYELIKNDKSRKDHKSLRLVNWFVTNFAKHYTTSYLIKKYNKIDMFLVWIEYDKELASEGKEYFDAFRRGAKMGKLIEIEYEKDKKLKTTVAQLNFFRWAIKNNVIDYVNSKVDIIYKDMIERGSNTKNRQHNPDGTVKKRQLSECVSKKLGHHNIQLALKLSINVDDKHVTSMII